MPGEQLSRARSASGSIGAATCVDCGKRRPWAGPMTPRGLEAWVRENRKWGQPEIGPRALGVVGCCRCDDCKDCRRVGCVCDLRGRRAIAPLRRKLADEIARLEATEAELLPLPVEDAWAEERAEWSRRDVRRGRSRG